MSHISTSLLPAQHPGGACTYLKQFPAGFPLPSGVFLLLDMQTCMHRHGEFFVIQHHSVSYRFAVEAQFLYHRLYTAPAMPSVKIKELPIILIKPKIKIAIPILTKIHIPYRHSGTGNTNHYSKPEENPPDSGNVQVALGTPRLTHVYKFPLVFPRSDIISLEEEMLFIPWPSDAESYLNTVWTKYLLGLSSGLSYLLSATHLCTPGFWFLPLFLLPAPTLQLLCC